MDGQFYFLLAHPGGPFYKKKDEGAWGIPKGLIEKGEDPLTTARREFREETNLELEEGNFVELPVVRYKNGKTLYSWALEVKDLSLDHFKSNTFEMEWPPKSSTYVSFDEIDQLIFFELTEAQLKIHPVQLPLLEWIVENTR
jgi:predicted NUDIX family NTP pyrophosphohydrolase